MARVKKAPTITEVAFTREECCALHWAGRKIASLSRLQARAENDEPEDEIAASAYRDRRWSIQAAVDDALITGDTETLVKLFRACPYSGDEYSI